MQKYIVSLLSVLLVVIACNTEVGKGRNGVSFKTATEYNDYIITRQIRITGLVNRFIKASAVSIDSAHAVLKASADTTDEYIKDIMAMSDFKGDTTFRNAAIQSFNFYKRIFSEQYKTLLDINSKGEAATEEELNKAATISQSITTEEADLDKRFLNAQSDFAQKNKLQLDGSVETQKRLQNAQD